MVIFRVFLNKLDTLNLSYYDQREQKSQGSLKKNILGEKSHPQNRCLVCMTSVTAITPAECTLYSGGGYHMNLETICTS